MTAPRAAGDAAEAELVAAGGTTSSALRRWTDEEEAELRKLLAADQSLRRIAQQLGRSERAINERRRLLGVYHRV